MHVLAIWMLFGLVVSYLNDTTRAQINNIPSKSHFIPLLTLGRTMGSVLFFEILKRGFTLQC